QLQPPPLDPETPPPPLSRNTVSFIGWIITLVVAAILVLLVAYDLLMHGDNPYTSVVTYLMLPGVLMGGVGLILFGVLLGWRRRHQSAPGEYPPLPTINLHQSWQRRRILIGAALLSLFFTGSAIGVYQSYHFTESTVFCGM